VLLEDVDRRMSAFEKREASLFGNDFMSPPVTFCQLSGNTPNKRIRSEHVERPSRGFPRPDHRSRPPRSPQASPGLHRRVPNVSPGIPSFTLTSPMTTTGSPSTGSPVDNIKATFREEPPPGIAPEAGIQWLETAESHTGYPDEEAVRFGTTPEMPFEHTPWCGSPCPPKPPTLRSRPPPSPPDSPFELTESEYSRYGYEYFGHIQQPRGDLDDEWSDQLEDEARHDGIVTLPDTSGSFLANSGLAMTLEAEDPLSITPVGTPVSMGISMGKRSGWLASTPEGGSVGRQRCESMLCSPIFQGLPSSGSPYGWGTTPQANSVPRECSQDLLDSSMDSSDDEIEELELNQQEPSDDDDHENFLFEFSPTIPKSEEESLKHMNHIYI